MKTIDEIIKLLDTEGRQRFMDVLSQEIDHADCWKDATNIIDDLIKKIQNP